MRITIVVAALLWASTAAAQDHQVINPPGTAVGLPFSSAVRVGNLLYLSGQIGNVPGTRQLADTGITGQTHQALENVKARSEEHTSELQSPCNLVCRLLLEKKKNRQRMQGGHCHHTGTKHL